MLCYSESSPQEEGSPNVTGTFARRVKYQKLNLKLERALAAQGSGSLFKVQKCVLRRAFSLHGFERDVCITSPTGSGKTLAYMLPLLQILSKRLIANNPAALILVPSSELAIQVCAASDSFCRAISARITLLQHGLRTRRQRDKLFALQRKGKKMQNISSKFSRHFSSKRKYSHIVVASPGALASLQSCICLEMLKFAVVDETDRMLQQTYQNWPQILHRLSNISTQKRRIILFGQRKDRTLQLLLCSATLAMVELQRLCLHAPELVNVHDRNYLHSLPHTISEFLVVSDFSEKFAKLLSILHNFSSKKVIVFCASSARTETLFRALSKESDLVCYEFSSRISQSRRARILRSFHVAQDGILIASDAATRGLHIDSVSVVISYDCPTYHKTHLHRAGRTGRAGGTGSSFTICTSSEAQQFQQVCGHNIQAVDPLTLGALNLRTAVRLA